MHESGAYCVARAGGIAEMEEDGGGEDGGGEDGVAVREESVETDAAPFPIGAGRRRTRRSDGQGKHPRPARSVAAVDSGFGSALNGLDSLHDDSDTASTRSTCSTCSGASSDGGVPDGVRAVLDAALDIATSTAPAMAIETITVENSTCQIGNSMHVHGPLTVVVSSKAIGSVSAPGLVLSAANLGLKEVEDRVVASPSLKEAGCRAPVKQGPGPLHLKHSPDHNTKGPAPQCARRPCVALVAVAAALAAAVVFLTAQFVGYSPSGVPGEVAGNPPTPPTPPPPPISLPHGVKYVPKSLWHARPAKNSRPSRLRTPVDTVIVHHSGTGPCASQRSCSDMVYSIQQYNMVDNGWDDIGYNFLVGGDGRVYEGRGWDVVGAFLWGWNSRALGVGVVGTFTAEMPPPEQRQQLAGFLQWGVDLGKIKPDYRLVGACQLQPTKSPGLRFMQDLRTWSHWWDTGAEKCFE